MPVDDNMTVDERRKYLKCVAGRVVAHARKLSVRLSRGHPAVAVLVAARGRLLALARGSPA